MTKAAEIVDALEQMGFSPNWVAWFLEDHGITGIPQNPTRCPVAINVHAPKMYLVGGLEVAVAEQAYRADETMLKRAENNPLRSAPKLLTNCVSRGGEVVGGRGAEGEWRVLESVSPQLCICLGVVVSQLSDHSAERRRGL
jgi:hypothetical protein